MKTTDDNQTYESCLVESKSFTGYNTLDEYCDWLFTDKAIRGATVIAHNQSGYDGRFILKWCLSHGLHPDIFIRSGNRIMYMSFHKNNNNLRFVDSLHFFL